MFKAFASARESLLILMDPLLAHSSQADPFVRLHGMLFARLQLDLFDDQVDLFFDSWGNNMEDRTDTQWALFAISNIAALYQYNRKDSRLKEALRQGRREKREAEQEEMVAVEDPADSGDTILPTSPLTDNLHTGMANVDRAPEQFRNITNTSMDDDISLSTIVFDKTCQFSFALLSEALNSGQEAGPVIHVHIWLVFLVYALKYQSVVRLLERNVPWQELTDFLNEITIDEDEWKQVLEMKDLPGSVLPEDSIMRGFEWSRKLFPKDWFQGFDPLDDLEDFSKSNGNVVDSREFRILTLGLQITKVPLLSAVLM